jgi:hypothetical protein
MKRRILRVLSVCLLVFGMVGGASAQGNSRGNGNGNGHGNGNANANANANGNGNTSSVPEIDPSSAAQAIALLTAGLLVIRERRRRR